MLNIAITGGIGSGKTAVTKYLKTKGYIIIDADEMAREMTGPGGKAIPYIIEHFGNSYINEDGSMNRVAMRDLVFNHPSYKAILEEGTTKVVIDDIKKIKENSERSGVTALFYDIPQLFEHNLQDDYDLVWVITADYEIRKERIKKRDVPENIIDLIIGSQAEDDERIINSNEVIFNNKTKEDLYEIIDELLKKYNL